MRAVVILNSRAGSAQQPGLRERIVTICEQNGIEPQIVSDEAGQSIKGIAARAAQSRPDVVIAAGGDGTLSAVASALAGTGVALGVLPVGTLNHFAKDAGIPLDLEDAIRTAVTGVPASVDVGEVNGRFFLNNSSLGLYATLVEERKKEQIRGIGKWPAFFRALVLVVSRYPLLHIRLSANGEDISRTTPFVFIGNNVYDVEGLHVGSRHRLDAGELFVMVSGHVSRLQLLWSAIRTLFSGVRAGRAFDCLVTREVVIHGARRSLRVAIDGEVTTLETPLHYHIRPGALRVMLPRAAEKAA
jgi:diacylglycerol kinase family enzyme